MSTASLSTQKIRLNKTKCLARTETATETFLLEGIADKIGTRPLQQTLQKL